MIKSVDSWFPIQAGDSGSSANRSGNVVISRMGQVRSFAGDALQSDSQRVTVRGDQSSDMGARLLRIYTMHHFKIQNLGAQIYHNTTNRIAANDTLRGCHRKAQLERAGDLVNWRVEV